jgi:hypothetical protein
MTRKPKKSMSKLVAVRLSRDVLDQADALISQVGRLPEFKCCRSSRSAIIRLAILRGLPMIADSVDRRACLRASEQEQEE